MQCFEHHSYFRHGFQMLFAGNIGHKQSSLNRGLSMMNIPLFVVSVLRIIRHLINRIYMNVLKLKMKKKKKLLFILMHKILPLIRKNRPFQLIRPISAWVLSILGIPSCQKKHNIEIKLFSKITS